MNFRNYKAGQILFHEGDRSRHIYRLVSGRMVVARHSSEGCDIIGNLNPGEFIGEMGVLVSSRRSGTARFIEDSVVEEFDRRTFLKLIAADPGLSTRLLHTLSLRTRAQVEVLRRLPETNITGKKGSRIPTWLLRLMDRLHEQIRLRLKSVPLSRRSRTLLAGTSLPERVFPKGTPIFEEGDASKNVLWIQSGRIRVSKRLEGTDAVRDAGFVGANEFLGEMGVLESLPRSASAIAATDVVARELSPCEFIGLMHASPSAYYTVIDSLCERARRLRRTARREGISLGASTSGAADSDNLFDVVRSIDGVAQLAERRLIDEAARMRRFFHLQIDRGRYVADTYQRYLKGEVSREEMERANSYLRDYVKMAGIGTLLILPGSPLTIPLVAKIGKALGVDIFPAEEENLHENAS